MLGFRSLTSARRPSRRPHDLRRSRLRPTLEAMEGRTLMTLNVGTALGIGGTGITIFKTAIDKVGDVYMTGNFTGTVAFDPPTNRATLTANGDPEMFVAKYSPSNTLLWVKALATDHSGGETLDSGTVNQPMDIAVDASGNAYVVGKFHGNPVDFDPGSGSLPLDPRSDDIFVVKLDTDGNVAAGGAKRFGSSGQDQGASIAIDPSGQNIYIGGSFQGTVNFDPGGTNTTITGPSTSGTATDGFVLKLSNNLGFVWVKDESSTDRVQAIAVNGLGNVYATGRFGSEAFIEEYSSVGNSIGVQSFGTGGTASSGVGVKVDSQGNAYVVGLFNGTNVDFDPNSATSYAMDSAEGSPDAFLVKFSPALAFVWARRLGSTSIDSAFDLAIDAQDNLYIVGGITGAASFGGSGAGTVVLHTANDASTQTDAFIIKVKPDGTYVEGKAIGGAQDEFFSGLAINAAGQVGVVGTYVAPSTFGTTTLQSAGAKNVFLGHLSIVDPVPPPPPVDPVDPTPVTPVPPTPVTPVNPTPTGPVAPQPAPVATGVVSTLHSRRGAKLVTIVLGFSGTLNPTSAVDGSHYSLAIGRRKRGAVVYDRPAAIGSITYDSSTNTVSLTLARPFRGLFQVVARAGILAANGATTAAGLTAQVR